MAEPSEADQFVEHLISVLGPGEALVTALRIVLAVAQRTPEDPRVLGAAREAIDAVQRLAHAAGYATPPPDPDPDAN